MLDLSIISGRVLDEQGHPIREAVVGAAGARDVSVARTNAQGRFSLGIASPGPVRLLARRKGYLFAIHAGVAPWTTGLELVLARGGSLSGRVVAAPLPGRFRVRVRRWDGSGWMRTRMASTLRRHDGRFNVTRLPAGLYEIAVEADGFAAEAPAVYDLRAGEQIFGIEIPLRPDAR